MEERPMFTTKVAAAAALLVLLGGTAACGSSDSSASKATAGGPTDADKASFCATFPQISSSTTPKDATDLLSKVGTPSDITADGRHGYELLLAQLATMSDKPDSGDFDAALKSLSTADQASVTAFLVYLAKECPSSLPTAPAS
jgi:hypothetical protein